ncbi:AP endonuclease [Streptosporangium violaceochromogenes]|nr:AP endonuclease [Streptosporangium violaceochromogenes]
MTLAPVSVPGLDLTSRPKVLVVGLDGLRYDRLLAVRPPNIRRLMEEGTFATGLLDLPPKVRSSSGPGWATVLTGVSPARHGVRNNSFSGHQFAKYPDFLTRLEQVRPSLHTAAVTTWGSLVTLGAVGARVDWHAVGHNEPYRVGVKDALLADRMVDLIRTSEVDAAFMHLEVTDVVAHRSGVLGSAYREVIEWVDGHLGRLFGAIRARPAFAGERWTVIVTTDHGHRDEGGHGGDSPRERRVFVLAAGPGIARGVRRNDARLVDVAATVFGQLGVPRSGDLEGRSMSTIKVEK